MADTNAVVAERRAAMLAPMVAAVRRRRHRRQALRAALAVAVVALGFATWRSFAPRAAATPSVPLLAPVTCQVVAVDPTVMNRLTVATTVRTEWFVDDRALANLLAAAQRPSGLVRSRDTVWVVASAVDPIRGDLP